MSKAIEKRIIHSSHTPTLGGLGIALAMTAFAGGYGVDVDLRKIPYFGNKRNDFVLFSESNSRFIVTIAPEKRREFEEIMGKNVYCFIGIVTEYPYLKIKGLDENYVVNIHIKCLKESWKKPLMGI
jgi:phosphoribosylformylglycinamidine synthase